MNKIINQSDTLRVNLKDLPNNVENDIREYCEDNKKYRIFEDDSMEFREAIFCYLEQNGVHGYTNDIVGIIINISKK